MKIFNLYKYHRSIGVTKNMKNSALKSAAQISASQNKHCNLLASKLDKTWHFIFATVYTLKQTLLLQQGHKKNTQVKLLSQKSNENKTEKSKNCRVAFRKALSL
jgi:hypothetical protein